MDMKLDYLGVKTLKLLMILFVIDTYCIIENIPLTLEYNILID